MGGFALEMVSAKIVAMTEIFLKSSLVSHSEISKIIPSCFKHFQKKSSQLFEVKILKIIPDFSGHFQKNHPRSRAVFPRNRSRRNARGREKLRGSGRDLDVRVWVDDAVEAARGGALRLFGFGIYPAEGDIVA